MSSVPYSFRTSNKEYIREFLASGPSPEQISELVLEVNNPDQFLPGLLDHLVKDPDWPLAISPQLIVNRKDEEALDFYAKAVIDIVCEQDVFGFNILDFGCGTGHPAAEAVSRGARQCIGYDLEASPFWPHLERPGLSLTTNWKDVQTAAPYDLIILFDVIDHVMDREPRDVLTDLAKMLTKDGQIFMRCHPWITRHGGHLYEKLNRAFAHVIFDDALLRAKGYEVMPTRKVIHPMWSYKNWIQKANLSIIKDDKLINPIADYFLGNELLKGLISRHFKNSPFDEYRDGGGDLERILNLHFIDFWLAR